MDSTHYTEIHLIHQGTQNHTVVQLGGLYEHGQADWVLDQTGVDYSRFRFVGDGNGVRMEYLEGDGVVLVDGAPMQSSLSCESMTRNSGWNCANSATKPPRPTSTPVG
jgi:hypothetical protein